MGAMPSNREIEWGATEVESVTGRLVEAGKAGTNRRARKEATESARMTSTEGSGSARTGLHCLHGNRATNGGGVGMAGAASDSRSRRPETKAEKQC